MVEGIEQSGMGVKAGSHCIIHQHFYQNIVQLKYCLCERSQDVKQQFHQNNFMHLINAHEVIDMQITLAKNHKSQSRSASRSELCATEGKLMGIARAINDKDLEMCIFSEQGSGKEEAKCKHQVTKVRHYICEPLPSWMCFNVNWYDNQVPYMDILRFGSSIP
jgi:hypothetical protein